MKAFITVMLLLLSLLSLARKPTINSFSPGSGPVGTAVALTGVNFNATAANNIVDFGVVKAVVTTASSTSLTATAPAGAIY